MTVTARILSAALATTLFAGIFNGFAQDATSNAIDERFAREANISRSSPLQSRENLSFGAVAEAPGGGASASELNQQLSNPGEQPLVHLESV